MKGLFQCPPRGGSLTHSQALRCSEPLRSKVGGPSKIFAMLCEMGPPGCCGGDLMLLQSPRHGCAGWDRLGIAVYSLQLIVIVYG